MESSTWHTPILGGIARNNLYISRVQFVCTICTATLKILLKLVAKKLSTITTSD